MSRKLTTDADLTAVADAIRTKSGISALLEYPNDFISAINTIETSGSTSAVKLMDHGQVSDTWRYMTATFENAVDFSAYDYLLIYLFRESETYCGATNIAGAFGIVGGDYSSSVPQIYTMAITTTQISCTHYRGRIC